MKKILLLGVVFLLLLVPHTTALPNLEEEVTLLTDTLREEFSEGYDDKVANLVIIKGSQLSATEFLAIELMKSQSEDPDFFESMTVHEKDADIQQLLATGKTVISVGGPSQNQYTREVIDQELVNAPEIEKDKLLARVDGVNANGGKIIILSTVRSFQNLGREAALKSPLAKIIDPVYVPVAASLLMIIITYLISFFSVFEGKFLASLGQKRASIKETYHGFKVRHFHFKYREYLAIFVGALLYGFAIALNFTGLDWKVFEVLQLTALVTLSIFVFKEGLRLALSFVVKLHTEYKLWVPGIFLSMIGSWLGNTFNSVGFMLEKKDEEYTLAKSGFVRYLIVWALFIGGSIFFVVNLLDPSRYAQMIMVSATTAAIVELFPIKPMYGPTIKQWRPFLWFFTLVLLSAGYIVLNFVI